MPATFDINRLRKRQLVHDMHADGFANDEIARSLRLTTKDVRRYLRVARPQVKNPLPALRSDRMACKGVDVNLFYPEEVGYLAASMKAEAINICNGCPVRERCHEIAEANYERHGVWGGVDRSRFSYRYDDHTGVVHVWVRDGRGAFAKVG